MTHVRRLRQKPPRSVTNMPGLAGIVSTTPLDNIGNALTRMAGMMRHADWYKIGQFVSPDRTLACSHVHLGILPTHDTPYRWVHGEESDSFTRIEFDPTTRVLTITNDPFGMMPVFYFATSSLLVFATELKAVL